MIRYLKESSENEKLRFIDDEINPVYEKMLCIVVNQYDRKTEYKYDSSKETASINVIVESPADEKIREKEAKRFIDWYSVAINEVVIDDYKGELKK